MAIQWHAILILSLFQVGVALPFTEWLDQLVLNVADVPQINLVLPIGSAVVDIQTVRCHNISLGNLSVETGSVQGFATNFGLDGLGLKCEIKLQNAKIKVGFPFDSGEIDIDLTIQPGLVSAGLAIPASDIESAPLPEGANLTACSAPLVLDLVATGTTRLGRKAAGIINTAARDFTPQFVSSTACGLIQKIVGRLNETIVNVSSALVEDNALVAAGDYPEPELPGATNINEMLQTGVLGHSLQQVIHNGRYNMSNTSQLIELVRGMFQILEPTKVPPLITALMDRNFTEPLSFSFESSLGSLTADLALDKCAGELPSPLFAGATTNHAQQVSTGHLTGHCGVDLQFNLIPQTLSPQTFGMSLSSMNISVDAGELDVSTSLAAAITDVSVYVSLLLGIDGYTMINDYSTDQWFRPGCLLNILDGKDPNNLGLLGLQGTLGGATLDLHALDQDPTIGHLLPAVSQWANALLEAYQPAIALWLQGQGTKSVVDHVNEKVIQNWFTSSDSCAASGYQSPVNQPLAVTSGVWTLAFGGLALIAAIVLLVQCTMHSVRKVEGGQQNLLTESELTREGSPPPAQAREGGAISATVSRIASWTMNLFLLATMGLLVISLTLPNNNLQTTAIDTDPRGGGATTQTGSNLLQFTIWSLALDLGRYGLPEIAVLIIFGSVIMPLAQIALMLACWNLPPSALSMQRRGQILAFLAVTLKSAWLGTFLLAILVKAMQVPFSHADATGGTAQFIVEVCPESGFYTYAVASLASMCLNEGIMATNRRVAESSGKKGGSPAPGGAETGDAEAAAVPAARSSETGEAEAQLVKAPVSLLVERSVVSALTWVFVLASPVLLIVGLGINSFVLGQPGSLQGALKWALNGDVNQAFSVFESATSYPWPTQATGVVPLQIGFVFIVAMLAWLLIIAPVVLSICSLVLWAVPLSPSGRKRALQLSEFMFNWQALDIYAACIIVMCLLDSVLSRVLDAIVSNDSALDSTCTGLNGGFGIQCITVHVQVSAGMVVLVAGIISFMVTKFLVGYQAQKVIGE